MKERWEDWHQPHLVLDTAAVSPETGLRRILDLIAHADAAVDDRAR